MKERRGWKGARYQEKGFNQEARNVFDVKVELAYLNPEYDLEVLTENRITEQGLLLVGRLIPKQPSLPEFWLRWDEKGDHLNIDMIPDEGYRYDWRNELHGYKGHRPQKASDRPGRTFNLLITTPNLKVFNGVISFNLARDVAISPPTVTIGGHAFAPEVSVKAN